MYGIQTRFIRVLRILPLVVCLPGAFMSGIKKGASFAPKYKNLLCTTTVATAEDTAKVAGIDLGDKGFWRSTLKTIADQINLFYTLVEE